MSTSKSILSQKQVIEDCQKGLVIKNQEINELTWEQENINYPIQFKDCKIKKLRFINCTFSEKISFRNTIFQEKTDISTSETPSSFQGDVYFSSCSFEGEVVARSASFFQGAHWKNCSFLAKANFSRSSFQKSASFEKSKFCSSSRFEECFFAQSGYFEGVHFQGKANFKKSCFSQGAQFREVRFEEDTSFENSRLGLSRFEDMVALKKANFKVVNFSDRVYFHRAEFNETVSFRGSEMQSRAYFCHLKCKEDADFCGVEVLSSFSLEHCMFRGKTKLEQVIIHQDAFLRGSNFHEEVSFQDSIFKMRLDLSSVQFHKEVILYGARPNGLVLDLEQIKGKIFSENRREYIKAKEVYLLLRRTFEVQGNHEATDWAYYHFRRAERLCQAPSLLRSFHWLFFDLGCGYGTKPFNVTILAAMIISLFSLGYWSFSDQFIIEEALRNQGQKGMSIAQAFYISAMTFSTLGTENIAPHFDGWLKYLLVIESFAGLFLMTVFVGTYTRKMVK